MKSHGQPARKIDPIFGVASLAELGQKCRSKLSKPKFPRRRNSQLQKLRQQYIYGVQEEAP